MPVSLFFHNIGPMKWGDMKYIRGQSHIESSHSLCQNDAKLQTHPPNIHNVKMPNLPKIDAYNS